MWHYAPQAEGRYGRTDGRSTGGDVAICGADVKSRVTYVGDGRCRERRFFRGGGVCETIAESNTFSETRPSGSGGAVVEESLAYARGSVHPCRTMRSWDSNYK